MMDRDLPLPNIILFPHHHPLEKKTQQFFVCKPSSMQENILDALYLFIKQFFSRISKILI